MAACYNSVEYVFVQQDKPAALHIFISGPTCFCRISACCVNCYNKTVAHLNSMFMLPHGFETLRQTNVVHDNRTERLFT